VTDNRDLLELEDDGCRSSRHEHSSSDSPTTAGRRSLIAVLYTVLGPRLAMTAWRPDLPMRGERIRCPLRPGLAQPGTDQYPIAREMAACDRAGVSSGSGRSLPSMPSRNDRCPCGSGAKFKRCCLVRLDAVARELRERDAFLDDLTAWLRVGHEATVEEAGRQTAMIRMLRGPTGGSMSIVWALNDYRPADGGPTLIERYAACPEASASGRAIARGLGEARLDVYRVRSVAAGAWLELHSLSDDTSVRVAWRDGLEHLRHAETLVARVVRATSLPTLWGPGARFPAGGERRWRARLATSPTDPAQAALALLEFHPDDAAEPLPDGVELNTRTWSIQDDEAVLETVEDEDTWKCLGRQLPDGWAFAWPNDSTSGAADLGGWQERRGEIEAARLVVCEHHVALLSGDQRTLQQIASHLEAILGALIAQGSEARAA
jgi:hypothetical protein